MRTCLPASLVEMDLDIGRWTDEGEIPEITSLLHRSYAPLAAMGFRFLATHQDEAVTLERLGGGASFIARDGGRIIGAISLYPPDSSGHCEWYALPGVARFGQFGVLPECQGLGVGSRLLDRIESRALELGAVELACDTAEGATHLIEMYSRRGYRLVGHADWEETNYRSVILSKGLGVGLEGGGG